MTTHNIMRLQLHEMVFLVEKTEQRVKRMDYIPLQSGRMKLNYSSSINEQNLCQRHSFQILFRLEVSVKGVVLCERKPLCHALERHSL